MSVSILLPIGVCDYYNQYYKLQLQTAYISSSGTVSTMLLKWFEKNVYKLSKELKEHLVSTKVYR